jgi:hypothetical protein
MSNLYHHIFEGQSSTRDPLLKEKKTDQGNGVDYPNKFVLLI